MDLWLLVFVLVVGLPALAYWRFIRIAGRRETAPTSAKLRLYFTGAVTQWVLVAYCAWVLARRDLSLANIGWTGGAHPVVWILAGVLTAALIFVTYRSVQGLAGEDAGQLPDHLRRLLRILPTNRIEFAAFAVPALTAGFCEEILYRGFLLYAFDLVLPHIALAVVLGGVVFGIGHTYQGRQGMIITAVLGTVLGVLYVAGGSLWPVIFVHAVIDLCNGYILGAFARRLRRSEPVPVLSPVSIPSPEEEAPAGEASGEFDGDSAAGS